jgi:hypothetical protein
MALLRINPAPTFTAPVRITVPGQDEPATIQFTFAHRGKKDLRDWVARAADRADPEFLGEVVRGWSGVLDRDDADVPFTPEAFARLLDAYPAAGTEIFQAYMGAFHEARAKN